MGRRWSWEHDVSISDPGEYVENFEEYIDGWEWHRCKRYRPIVSEMFERFGTARIGSTRMTFVDQDGDVVKVPYRTNSEKYNKREYNVFLNNSSAFIESLEVAECLLEKHKGFWILRMEWVTPLTRQDYQEKDIPSWVDELDSGQAGFTRDGRLVAFDAV